MGTGMLATSSLRGEPGFGLNPGRYERSGGIYGTGVGELKVSRILKSRLEIPVLILLKFLFYSFYFYLVLFLFVKVTF